jgi:hypothetical protein
MAWMCVFPSPRLRQEHSEPHTYPDNWIAIATGLANAGQELYLNNRSADEFMKSAQDSANK